VSGRILVVLGAVLLMVEACAPRATPLQGAPAPDRALPAIPLAGAHRHVVFKWDYEENSLMVHGEGAIRASAPDSARVDLFLVGGVPAGHAILIGDSLRGTNTNQIRKVLPPPPMMWATLGRLAVPPLPDTVMTVDGATIYADIGRPAAWRVTIKAGRLMQLAHLNGGRISEVVTRDDGGRLLYEVPGGRKLWLGIIRDEEVPGFDAAIWTR
jgi:hypothetical protein